VLRGRAAEDRIRVATGAEQAVQCHDIEHSP
jgi:hypothetical protein